MRVIVFMRGAPGSGKTTMLKKLNLEPYAISPDSVRLLFSAPVLKPDGSLGIDQKNDKDVWELVNTLTEKRMESGQFIAIDACFGRVGDFSSFKKLADKYRYRAYVLDLSDVPLETCLERNKKRPEHKIVPEEYIKLVHERYKINPVPKWIKPITEDNFKELVHYRTTDFNKYSAIHVIGDIHGCLDPLSSFITQYGCPEKNPNKLYLFLGDYIDRGIQNVEVLKYLINIHTLPNVILLEGNHENALRQFAHNEFADIKSADFMKFTRIQLEESDLQKNNLASLCRKLSQISFFEYGGKVFLASHGGVSRIPFDLIYLSSKEFIRGVGKYQDMELVNNTFINNTPDNVYQIHGHRNIKNSPIRINDRCFNLCDTVEHGGNLRVLTISKDKDNEVCFTEDLYKNNVFKLSNILNTYDNELTSIESLVINLKNDRDIRETVNGNISSFNFTKHVFYKKKWNERTVKARGLFINTNTNNIVARSYDKFFYINEVPLTEMKNLANILQYPIKYYVKENGFLGILGYDQETDSIIITSKSRIDGQYADLFKNMLKTYLPEYETIFKDVLKTGNSAVFEVINVGLDPHIIEYPHDKLVLLDIVKNSINFSIMPYNELFETFQKYENENFHVKKLGGEIASWSEFVKFNENFESNIDSNIEGFVLMDAGNLMLKCKGSYYTFWKHMRSVLDRVKSNTPIKGSELNNVTSQRFYNWLRNNPELHDIKNIIDARSMFKATLSDLNGLNSNWIN